MARATSRPARADVAVLAVGGRFLTYSFALSATLTLLAAKGGLESMMVGTAKTSTALISVTGVRAARTGAFILLPNRVLAIDPACTALFIAALFAALVLAHPAKPRMKMLGLLIGIPLILAVNIARIVAMAHVAVASPQAFGFVHDYLFEVGMLLFTAGLWAAWLATARRYAR